MPVAESFSTLIPSIQKTSITIDIRVGEIAIILGANGSGKSRLAVFFEDKNKGRSLRVSAQRALDLRPHARASEAEYALKTLHEEGLTDRSSRLARHGGGDYSQYSLVDDFDLLMVALYADQAKVAHAALRAVQAGNSQKLQKQLLIS